MNDSDRAPRQRIVAGAADMIRRRGLNATSIRDVAEHAGAPLVARTTTSQGGKQQLAAEAVRFRHVPGHAERATLDQVSAQLEHWSGWRSACDGVLSGPALPAERVKHGW
jgi:DNA-binding transcriptional regulator YbjK